MNRRTYTADRVPEFKKHLRNRLRVLADESGLDAFSVAVGLFFVVDKPNGGDATAEELSTRFRYLDLESQYILDFYFFGWHADATAKGGISFDLENFIHSRNAFRDVGVKKFGGYADLILCNASYDQGKVHLEFSEAIYIDLALALKKGTITTLGGFLQAIIETSRELRMGASDLPTVAGISDRLGLAIARKSILDYILDTWAKAIGGSRLREIATRRIGSNVDLKRL